MTQPTGSNGVDVMVQSLLENAKRLGLTWDLRPATVKQGNDPSRILAVYDGDIQLIPMSSTIGPLVTKQRVYVIAIPPAGHFIIGTVGTKTAFGVEMRQTPGQIFGHNSEDMLIWTNIVRNNGFDITPPIATFTIPVPGVWSVDVTLRWPSNANGWRRLNIYRNGPLFADIGYPTINGAATPQSISKTMWCNAGDTINARAMQFTSSGTNLTLGTTSETPNIAIWRVG